MEAYRNYGSGNNCRGNFYRGNQPRNMNSYGCNKMHPMNKNCGCNTMQETRKDCGCNTMQETRRDCGCNTMQGNSNDCGCQDSNRHMRHMPVGIGYVPMQPWGELYDPATALCQGTAFPDLNLIFCGIRGKM